MANYRRILIFMLVGAFLSQIIRFLGLDIALYYSFIIGVMVGLVLAAYGTRKNNSKRGLE
jgi:uncharacterized membrane protein YczE